MGFGKVANSTQLGQRLNFAAFVHLESDESLDRRCVFAEVMVGDNRLQPGQVRVTLEGGRDSADRNVRVTTSAVIDEPVVTVNVTLGCGSRVTRSFVVFVDPPGIELAQAVPADESLRLPQRADSQVAQVLALTDSEPKARPLPPRAARSVSTRSAAPRAAAESGSRRVASAHRAVPMHQASTAARNPGARLQLEAPTQVAARKVDPVASATKVVAASAAVPAPVPAVAAASSVTDVQAELLAVERRRLQLLEEGMGRLRADSVATQKELTGLQARLRDAEAARYSNPLVYALAALCGLLAAGMGALTWRQSRNRSAAQWWAVPAGAGKKTRPERLEHLKSAAESTADLPTVLSRPVPLTAVDLSLPGRFTPAATAPSPAAAVLSTPMPLRSDPTAALEADAARESSVEELIDLEQQAEFFIVLGQDDAAVELLTSHLSTEEGASPLPYLKLMEIHRRCGDEADYTAIREAFNRRFNAHAPDWHADLRHGRSLEDYPEVVARLQRLWKTPSQAMEALEESIFRRSPSQSTFDLPAYRELLFLYAIARDRAERGAAESDGSVDLLLPLAEVSAAAKLPGRPRDFRDSEFLTAPLDLDVSLAEVPARPPVLASHGSKPNGSRPPASSPAFDAFETVPSALRRPSGYLNESTYVDLELEPIGVGVPDSVR